MKKMEYLARKHEPLLKKIGYVMIPIGFIGMVAMIEELIRGIILLISKTSTLTVGIVLPIQTKGVFYVPFFYWIIAIVFIMVVHEFGHGLVARAHRVKVKSTGFAFLGALIPIIPGAFVEIDEKHLAKQSKYTQLSIFAAGPFVNIVFGLLFWGLFFLLQPASQSMFISNGMMINDVVSGSPAAITGLAVGELITQINKMPVTSVQQFEAAFENAQPSDKITITTNKGTKEAILGGSERGYLGIQVEEDKHVKESIIANRGWLLPNAFVWFVDLLFWLFLLNLGVGLFNLVPLGPIDGGRMFHTALQHLISHKHARNVWHATSFIMLAIIISTLVSSFV